MPKPKKHQFLVEVVDPSGSFSVSDLMERVYCGANTFMFMKQLDEPYTETPGLNGVQVDKVKNAKRMMAKHRG